MPSSPHRDLAPSAARRDGVIVETVDGQRLHELAGEWSTLWLRCRSATPFQAPEWLLAWARHYAPGRCAAVILRRERQLAALVPVFSWRGSLLLAGTGPSDYGDGLFLPGAEAWAASLLSALCEAPCGDFDRIDLRQLPPGSPLLSAAPPKGWADMAHADETCPVLRLQGDEGLAAASRRWCANWCYALRRIEREGGVFDLVSPEETVEAVAALERLHGLRWRERGEAGVLADPLLAALLRDALPSLARAGLVRLHRLRFDGNAAALLLALRGHRATHYYLSGFDPSYSRLSPGTALVGKAIAQAAQEGDREFHFLRGREIYKYRWGAQDRRTQRRIFTRL